MNTRTIDQLLYSSMTAYALAYIAQIDGVATMTRDEMIDNINDLYGIDGIMADGYTDTLALRYELTCQMNRDWDLDSALWHEIGFWRCKIARIESNEAAQYGAEWNLWDNPVFSVIEWGFMAPLYCTIKRNGVNIYRTQEPTVIHNAGLFLWREVTYCRYPLLDADRIEDQS
jgi:hypothetical protein